MLLCIGRILVIVQVCEQCQTRASRVWLDGSSDGPREPYLFCKQCADQIRQCALAGESTSQDCRKAQR